MPLVYNAQVGNNLRNAPSATHPYGVGVGWMPQNAGREFSWAGKQNGAWAFREKTVGTGQPIQGSNTVRMHQADANGVFHIKLGTVGDALTLKVDYENKTWRIDRHVDGKERPIDPQGLIDRERASVAFYVTSLLKTDGFEKGPSVPAEIGVAWRDGAYRFSELRPSTTAPTAPTTQTGSTAQTGFSSTSQMDQSLPSMAGQISSGPAPSGASALDVRLSAADRRAGALAELPRASLASIGLSVKEQTAVLKMADKVVGSVDRGSWLSLTRYADPAHKKTQLGMGMGTPQYVAELLGLHSVGNTLADGPITKAHLDTLSDLSFTSASRSGNIVTLTGEAKVGAGAGARTLRTQIDVDISNPAKPVLTGAVG